jgi:hypothetical protein
VNCQASRQKVKEPPACREAGWRPANLAIIRAAVIAAIEDAG